MRIFWILIALGLSLPVTAAELLVRVTNAPESGQLIFEVYDSASAFGELRDPALRIPLPATGAGPYRLTGVPAGDIALVVYSDSNGNGLLDKSFIGLPRESLALSNDYRPKGPPSFSRASFAVGDGETRSLAMSLYKVLGERGRVGVGIGVIGQSSPYLDSRDDVYQLIPAITYVGERLQWFGPTLRYGLAGSGKARLALAADYRIGAYDEDDADILAGLGDRDGTLMAGLSLQYEMPGGLELELAYRHDVLDRIGGGQAVAELSRGFQTGVVRFSPYAAVSWLSDELTNYDFGVPTSAATAARPAYDTGSSISYDLGVGMFVELSENWRIVGTVAAEFLDDSITDSPIVDDDVLFRGFAAFNYVF